MIHVSYYTLGRDIGEKNTVCSKLICIHKWVSADYLLMSNPPQRPYVCKNCGEKGIEVIDISNTRTAYKDILKKF